MSGKLSDYEKLRLANIDRNQQFLASIGLDGTSSSSSSSSAAARSSNSKTRRKASAQKASDDEVPQPTRRSKRTVEGNQMDDVESSNKRSKTSDISEAADAATDQVQRISSRAKKPVAFYKDEIQSIDEPKPRKSSDSSGSSSSSGKVEVYADIKEAIPTKNAKGELVFPDYPHFRPNLTPKEVLQKGSFGGTYFRPIYSRVTQQHYSDVWKELPADWLTGLNVSTQISSALYRTSINRYKEECGGDLDMWEGSGWITHIDPYGWFQWYCRFYQGRRSSDDERQISRGLGVMGPRGRWRNALINKCLAMSLTDPYRQSKERAQEVVDKHDISPKIRQLLQHWGYQLTVDDLIAAAKAKK